MQNITLMRLALVSFLFFLLPGLGFAQEETYISMTSEAGVGKKILLVVLTPDNSELFYEWANGQREPVDPNRNPVLKSRTFKVIGNITEFYTKESGLSSLDVTHCPQLKVLTAAECHLKSLDLSKTPNIERINVRDNELEALEVAHLKNLTELNCSINALKDLNLAGLDKLEEVSCYENKIATLNTDGCVSMIYLDLFSNEVASLNLADNAALVNLHCALNKLTSLDLSNQTKLFSVDCYTNGINGDNMTTLVNSLHDKSIKKKFIALKSVNADEVDRTELNSCDEAQYKTLIDKGWDVKYWDYFISVYEKYSPTATEGIAANNKLAYLENGILRVNAAPNQAFDIVNMAGVKVGFLYTNRDGRGELNINYLPKGEYIVSGKDLKQVVIL